MRVLAGLSLLLTSCTSNGAGSISGDMPGGNFDLGDTISAAVTTSDGAGGTSSDARIMMASTRGVCSDAGTSPPIDRKLQRYISISLRDVTGETTTVPTVPGTYTIYPDTGTEPPKAASLSTGAFDGDCQSNDADASTAHSGTVTLTSTTGGVFAGSFDVVLNTGGHITGSFDPEPCPQLQTAATSTATHSCL